MFESWGRFVYARRRLVLPWPAWWWWPRRSGGPACSAPCSPAAASPPPGSQSQQESNLAARAFGRDTADVVVLYRSDS